VPVTNFFSEVSMLVTTAMTADSRPPAR
jgi:hypothetical protein